MKTFLNLFFIVVLFPATLLCAYANRTIIIYTTHPSSENIITHNETSSFPTNWLPSWSTSIFNDPQEQPTFFENLLDLDEIRQGCKDVGNFCKDHGIEIGLVALLASYAWIMYQIKKTSTLLQNVDAWCNWQSNVAMSDLELQSEQDLFAQLKSALVLKYGKTFKDALPNIKRSNCDYVNRLMLDIKNELDQLATYKKWYTRTDIIYCNWLFDFEYDLLMIQEKEEKLWFVLNLCKNWCCN